MLIDDIEYVIFSTDDLSTQHQFLIDFGLMKLQQDDKALYMRAFGDAPFSYVAYQGERAFLGMGFRIADLVALDELSRVFSSPILDCPHPGGGKYVVGADPDGRRLEFVYGAERLSSVSIPTEAIIWNDARRKNRLGVYQRPGHGPSHCARLGHVALFTPEPKALIAWYEKTLGMIPSEKIYQGTEDNTAAAFMHLDKGEVWTDHHTVAIIGHPTASIEHVSFEVQNFDDLGSGFQHLTDKGYRHRWGVGRHYHGSQVFDYWYAPDSFHFEHFTDGDMVNSTTETRLYPFGRDTLMQWGPTFPG